MKFQIPHLPARDARRAARGGFSPRPGSAFTMIEVAICLAIIGFALVSILLVLPLGMNTQRDNREETIVNQDATVLLEAIRTGARGADDLMNYVYAIVITNAVGGVGYLNQPLADQMNFSKAFYPPWVAWSTLTSGSNIVGLLGTPRTLGNGAITNYVHAFVRAMSGGAADKPPQGNPTLVGDSFAYRLLVVNAPVPVGANTNDAFARQLAGNQQELRLTFRWPLLPNGAVADHGSSPQTFRATIAGQLVQDTNSTNLYFYHPQTFVHVP